MKEPDRPLSPLSPPEFLLSSGRWLVFSEITGLIVSAETRELAEQRYAQALPERRPLDFAPAPRPTPNGHLSFDFSVFHPLDHWAFGPLCRTFYGGGRRHLALWWDYEVGWLRPKNLGHALLCRLGRHVPSDSWQTIRERGIVLNSGGVCCYCWASLPRPWIDAPAPFFGGRPTDR